MAKIRFERDEFLSALGALEKMTVQKISDYTGVKFFPLEDGERVGMAIRGPSIFIVHYIKAEYKKAFSRFSLPCKQLYRNSYTSEGTEVVFDVKPSSPRVGVTIGRSTFRYAKEHQVYSVPRIPDGEPVATIAYTSQYLLKPYLMAGKPGTGRSGTLLLGKGGTFFVMATDGLKAGLAWEEYSVGDDFRIVPPSVVIGYLASIPLVEDVRIYHDDETNLAFFASENWYVFCPTMANPESYPSEVVNALIREELNDGVVVDPIRLREVLGALDSFNWDEKIPAKSVDFSTEKATLWVGLTREIGEGRHPVIAKQVFGDGVNARMNSKYARDAVNLIAEIDNVHEVNIYRGGQWGSIFVRAEGVKALYTFARIADESDAERIRESRRAKV